jgi:hypothetical protein
MRRSLLFVQMLLLATAATAQGTTAAGKPAGSDGVRAPYRLEYVIKEMDDGGKVINTRTYSLMLQSAEDRRNFGELKTGTRVPVRMNVPKEGESQIQYLDVGISISAQLTVVEGSSLVLIGQVEISTLAGDGGGSGSPPLIRQVRSNTTSEVTPGKVNQIAVLDDPISKHRFEIDVTPTRLR